ncbi:MAG TPA: ribosome small subunit-dependent GTPase A [Candidatus Limnocylindrales bacterium]|nr:ribosome small subunit-dependent GTPase A [Candidatus Limnocylindrales bacterium]
MAIQRPSDLVALGWDPGWASAFHPHESAGHEPARVAAAHRGAWVVSLGPSERDAVIAGRLRFEAAGPGDLPAVGDWVAIDPADASGPAVITAVLPRRSAFRRSNGDGRAGGGRLAAEQVLAANVDVALLVTGLDGDFNLRRLERYLTVAYAGGTRPVVVLNKVDLDDDVEGHRVAAEAVAPGVPVHAVSALTGHGLDRLASAHLRPGVTAVVLGSSGVGKSTLVNALLGLERQRTNDVRADDSKGRHTTTARELIPIGGGALIVDSPGIRSLEVAGAEAGIDGAFVDIAELATGCRFRDCAHDGEPGCAVHSALLDGRLDHTRFDSWRKLEREAAHAVRRVDPFARAEERRRWKAIHRSVGIHMKHKYGEG